MTQAKSTTRMNSEELSALLENYDAEARRLRSQAFKTFFSEWFDGVRQGLKNLFAQTGTIAHASE